MHPKAEDYEYNLDRALNTVVGVRTTIPEDAFTAQILGTERAGNGVLINDSGLILTIGYLITEAESIWISLADGNTVQGHMLAYDQRTGFGLVQALAKVDLPGLPFGNSDRAEVGESVVVAGAGGRHHSVEAQIVAKQEFVGYWEYVLDEAIYTAPSHPNWGGAALIGSNGKLLGIGSLQLESTLSNNQSQDVNMIVPIDLLKPILEDLKTRGRTVYSPRPWLGIYATEIGNRIVLAGLAQDAPAEQAELEVGDIVLSVAGESVRSLSEFFKTIWSVGDAGVEIPLRILRDNNTLDIIVNSIDRNDILKRPVIH